MGIGYAAPTPAALKWFGPHKRGLIAGLVVGGYGGAALYIAPLARWLIADYGLSGSFIILGVVFAVVVIIAGQLLAWPPAGYVPPAPQAAVQAGASPKTALTTVDWAASDMVKTWQFFALVLMFIGYDSVRSSDHSLRSPSCRSAARGNGLDPCLLWRSHQRVRPGRDRFVLRQNRQDECLYAQLPGFRSVPLRDACHYWLQERFAALPGCRHSLLAVRRRIGAVAVFYGGFLRAQEPGLQLRPGVHRMGSRLLHGKTWRNYQGHNRKPQLGLLSVRVGSYCSGHPGPRYKSAFCGRRKSTLACHEVAVARQGNFFRSVR